MIQAQKAKSGMLLWTCVNLHYQQSNDVSQGWEREKGQTGGRLGWVQMQLGDYVLFGLVSCSLLNISQ